MTDQEFQRLNQAYTQKYGAQKAPSSGGGTIDDFDRAVQQRRAAKKSEQTQEQQEEKGFLERAAGFGKEVVKGIARPIAKTAVTGVAALEDATRLATGMYDENTPLRAMEGYNVPGLGRVRPVGGGTVDKETGEVRYQTAGENLRDIVGTGAEVASTLATPGGASSIVKQGGKQAAKEAIKQGVKTGFAIGATGAAGSELQNQDATVGSVVKETLKGGGGGALIGGLGAGASSLLSQEGRAATKLAKAQKKMDEVVEYVAPKQDKKLLLEMAKRGEKAVEESGLLEGGKLKPTVAQKRIASSVAEYVDPKKPALKNITKINEGIADIAENQVTPFLEQNPGIYNRNTLKGTLDTLKSAKPLDLKNDAQLNKVYDQVIDEMLRAADGQETKNLLGLWRGRIDFDQAVKRQFRDKVLTEEARSARDIAIRDVREAVNDYIASNTPDDTFRNLMSKLSDMYSARDNIAEKAVTEIGKSKIRRYLDARPLLKETLKYGAGVAGGGALYGAGSRAFGGD